MAAVTPGAQIKSNDQILYVSSNALPGQRITTGKDEVLHVLLQDQSALTLGPESERLSLMSSAMTNPPGKARFA